MLRINNAQGVSLVEIIIAIAVMVLMLTIVLTNFSTLRSRQSLQTATADIVSVLKKANSQTLASIDSSTYGVHFGTNAVIIFKGTSYPSDTDETVNIALPAYISNVNLSGGGSDVYFNRLTGTPSKTGTITISIPSATKTITIGATGIISVN